MDECALTPCPDCGKPRVPVQWCPECGLTTHPDFARLREENERLGAAVNAARAEAMLHFEESHRWRQQAQVVDDGLCMAKERIAELEGELGLLLEYFEQGVPYWHGTSPKDRIRAVLKGDADDANVH